MATTTVERQASPAEGLDAKQFLRRYALLAAALGFAGPPIYIHAPAHYAVDYGLGLGAIGGLLLALRMLDFVQDPLLAWLIGRSPRARAEIATAAAVLLAIGVAGLFWPDAPMSPFWRFGLSLVCVFTGFSAMQILVYTSGVAFASARSVAHARVAGWREAGVLLGVCAACVLPEALKPLIGPKAALGVFAGVFCCLLALGLVLMRSRWPERRAAKGERYGAGFAACWQDATLRRLLVIGLINATPSGFTATLFLFFVQDRLEAPSHVGPSLLAFFLAAALAAPLWARVAGRIGEKRAMQIGMALAIVIFLWILRLEAGDIALYYAISIGSGAAVGADMTLLPAMLSKRLAEIGESGEAAFGVWGFINKAALAIAAGAALPALGFVGYEPGQANDAEALSALAIAYAGVPCLLKAIALAALTFTPVAPAQIVNAAPASR